MSSRWEALPDELKRAIAARLVRRLDRVHFLLASRQHLAFSHAIAKLKIKSLSPPARPPLQLVPAVRRLEFSLDGEDVEDLAQFLDSRRAFWPLAQITDVSVEGSLEQPLATVAVLAFNLPALQRLELTVPYCALRQATSCLAQLQPLSSLQLRIKVAMRAEGQECCRDLRGLTALASSLQHLSLDGYCEPAVDDLLSLGQLSCLTCLEIRTEGFDGCEEAINQIGALTNLRRLEVDFEECEIYDYSLWTRLARLEELVAWYVPKRMTDALVHLTSLRSLAFSHEDLLPQEVARLTQLTRLCAPAGVDLGAGQPARLPRISCLDVGFLESSHLFEVAFDLAAIASLSITLADSLSLLPKLTRLQDLTLRLAVDLRTCPDLCSSTAAALGRQLTSLHLEGYSPEVPQAYAALAGCSRLERLALVRCAGLSRDLVAGLAMLPRLQLLEVRGSGVAQTCCSEVDAHRMLRALGRNDVEVRVQSW
jgi:hypothetical protein